MVFIQWNIKFSRKILEATYENLEYIRYLPARFIIRNTVKVFFNIKIWKRSKWRKRKVQVAPWWKRKIYYTLNLALFKLFGYVDDL